MTSRQHYHGQRALNSASANPAALRPRSVTSALKLFVLSTKNPHHNPLVLPKPLWSPSLFTPQSQVTETIGNFISAVTADNVDTVTEQLNEARLAVKTALQAIDPLLAGTYTASNTDSRTHSHADVTVSNAESKTSQDGALSIADTISQLNDKITHVTSILQDMLLSQSANTSSSSTSASAYAPAAAAAFVSGSAGLTEVQAEFATDLLEVAHLVLVSSFASAHALTSATYPVPNGNTHARTDHARASKHTHHKTNLNADGRVRNNLQRLCDLYDPGNNSSSSSTNAGSRDSISRTGSSTSPRLSDCANVIATAVHFGAACANAAFGYLRNNNAFLSYQPKRNSNIDKLATSSTASEARAAQGASADCGGDSISDIDNESDRGALTETAYSELSAAMEHIPALISRYYATAPWLWHYNSRSSNAVTASTPLTFSIISTGRLSVNSSSSGGHANSTSASPTNHDSDSSSCVELSANHSLLGQMTPTHQRASSTTTPASAIASSSASADASTTPLADTADDATAIASAAAPALVS